jgi:hypothetical protein
MHPSWAWSVGTAAQQMCSMPIWHSGAKVSMQLRESRRHPGGKLVAGAAS